MTGTTSNTSSNGTDRNRGGDRPKPILVRAWVRHYDSAKGFGFATRNELHSERGADGQLLPVPSIYFNAKQCRMVEGSFDEPTLTRRPAETYVSSYGRNPDNLVMLVVPSDRPGRYGETSYRAIAWGKLPEKHWAVDLIKLGSLQSYIGSNVALTKSSDRGRRPEEVWRGTVEQLELTPEFIKLRVRSAGEVREVTYDLKDSHHSWAPKWGGSAVIGLWVDGDTRRLVFY